MNRHAILVESDRPTSPGEVAVWLTGATLAGWLYLTAIDPRLFAAVSFGPLQQLLVGLAILVTAFVLTLGAAIGWRAWLAIRRWI